MMLIGVNEELLEDFETERKWRNHINNSTLQAIHKEKQNLQEKLDIAVKALERIEQVNTNRAIDSFAKCQMIAEQALKEIEE